jgi:hypothetical protein
VIHELLAYWDYIGGNVAAMPVCGALAVVFAVGFRKPIAAWWHKHFGAKADLAEIRRIAEDSRKIAADLFEHHTGKVHPAAPKAEPPPYRPNRSLIGYMEQRQKGGDA